jgi:hypothetical protein
LFWFLRRRLILLITHLLRCLTIQRAAPQIPTNRPATIAQVSNIYEKYEDEVNNKHTKNTTTYYAFQPFFHHNDHFLPYYHHTVTIIITQGRAAQGLTITAVTLFAL